MFTSLSLQQNLPPEILEIILQCATDETLAVTAHVSRQMRCWSADIFLKRNKTIDLCYPFSAFVTLTAAALRHFSCLGMWISTLENTGRVIHLECELFDLVEYHRQAKVVFSALARFESVEIHFNCLEQTFLEDVRVPRALMSVLACAKRVCQLDITPSWVRLPPRQLSPSVVRASHDSLRQVEQLMNTLEKMSLSFDLMGSQEFRDRFCVFLNSSTLQTFTLSDITSEGLRDCLTSICLPALTELRLYSYKDRLHLPSQFFQCHPKLTHLSVITFFSKPEDTHLLEMLPIEQLPRLEDLTISSNHYNWVLDARGPSILRIQAQDMFPLSIPSNAFCTAVRSLLRPLKMVRVNGYSKRLLIRLPNGIERHADGRPSSLACCGCGEECIPGICAVELETRNLHASTLVSVLFSNMVVGGLTGHNQHFLSLWIKIFPSLTHLKVDCETQPLCTSDDLNSFLTSSLQCCPDLALFECPKVGTWRRRGRAGEWYNI